MKSVFVKELKIGDKFNAGTGNPANYTVEEIAMNDDASAFFFVVKPDQFGDMKRCVYNANDTVFLVGNK